MSKRIIAFLLCLCLLSCNTPKGEYKYLVEEKYQTLDGGGYRIIISDINTKYLRNIGVGKYTYEHINLGDTLIIKY